MFSSGKRVAMVCFMALLMRHLMGLLCLMLPFLAQSLTAIDDRGASIDFDKSPQRIVSLLPSLTETVCELDRCQRLVGVDRYSNYPSAVQHLTQVGDGLDPNLEAILALRPDVVLMSISSRTNDRLQSLGLKIMQFEIKTYSDVQRVLLKLGGLLEVQDPQKIWQHIDAGVSAAAQSVPETVRGTRVYFEVYQGPYAAGESSFIGETLKRLGVKNIVTQNLGPFPKLNPEFVVRANPELIMLGERGVNDLAQRPGWSQIRAVREQHVCVFLGEQGNVLVRPGPRMAQAARLMANCLTQHSSLNSKVKP
jgi:iron complex transport system substrate-binding protein